MWERQSYISLGRKGSAYLSLSGRYVWSRRGPPKSAPWTVEQEAVSESPFDLDDRFPALSTGDPSPDVVLIGSFIVQ